MLKRGVTADDRSNYYFVSGMGEVSEQQLACVLEGSPENIVIPTPSAAEESARNGTRRNQ